MARFVTTRWTLVQQAGDVSHPDAAAALEYLCRVYWPSVYVYFRRTGASPADASDLTQEFFARVLEKGYFDQARRERGTFRTFLLTCARNFLSNEWDRRNALKRGGGVRDLPLEFDIAEQRYQQEPHHALTPERIFERQWAWSLIQQSLKRLEADVRAAGRERMYLECRDLLLGEPGDTSYREIAQRLDLTEGALKVQVHRLRRRLRDLVIDEIEQTAGGTTKPDTEFQTLLHLMTNARP